jgi:hypothetical protein
MAVTYDEFYRLINKTIKSDDKLTVDSNNSTVSFPFSDGEINITLGEQQTRKIASLSIQHMLINFKFQNLTKNEIELYLNKFDITFQKGGG